MIKLNNPHYAIRYIINPILLNSEGDVYMYNSYETDYLGSYLRPIVIDKIKVVDDCKEVLISKCKFFDKLQFGCEPCHVFYIVIPQCLEYNDLRKLYLSDDNGCTEIEIDDRIGNFCYADQLRGYAGNRRIIKCLACFDPKHVNILSPITEHHKTCCCEPCFNDVKEPTE